MLKKKKKNNIFKSKGNNLCLLKHRSQGLLPWKDKFYTVSHEFDMCDKHFYIMITIIIISGLNLHFFFKRNNFWVQLHLFINCKNILTSKLTQQSFCSIQLNMTNFYH